MDLAKLKVAELKAELAARNLDTKGVKAVLLERLREAIERETNAAPNVDPSGQQQQYQAQQQQNQQQLLLQQQQQQQLQALQAQQQLHAQQQQQPQQNVVAAEQQTQLQTPQDQTIEDLSMSSKRVDTPVRRRSTRRSMTRSPSPTNSSADNPHASLMGSARKRGRSRSMTKSPSPQRLTSEAPCLESVQEEEPEPPVSAVAAEQRLEQPAVESTEPKADDTSVTAPVAKAPSAAPTLQESATPQPEPTAPSAMEVEESETTPAPEKAKEAEAAPAATESADASTAATATDEPVAKTAAEESAKPDKSTESKPAGSESASDSKEKPAATKPEKKQTGQQQAQNNVVEFVSEENEPQLSADAEKTFTLSWYDSDLNLVIDDKDLLSAKPLADGIFGLMWAGVRAGRGVTGGKVLYEVLAMDELQPATKSPLVPEGETPSPEMRIGWSTLAEGKRQLGESDHSFGYSSCGKKVFGGNFEEYGKAYGKGDIVGVYLDLDASPCRMEFTVNRVRQGSAFEFTKESLDGKALFPHVYAKNLSFKVNFGTVEDGLPLVEKQEPAATDKPATETSKKDEVAPEAKKETEAEDKKEGEVAVAKEGEEAAAKEETTSDTTAKEEDVKMEETDKVEPSADEQPPAEKVPFDEEYKFLNRFMEEHADCVVEGLKGPSAREECELVMMIGLPGSGKTTWVQKYLKENPDSTFTLLSIDSLLENMKVLGKAREPSNTPQWQKVVEQLSRNMPRLIDIACKRRRHILIDQTNVFASEQKRRLKGFGGFKTRRAVAVLPNLEEYKRRYEQKVAKYGAEVPETTLNTMKANIFVPTLEQKWYTEIVYTELPETEAQEMLKKLNEECRKLLPPRRNRTNQPNRQKHNNNNNSNANSNYTSRWNHNRPQGGGGGGGGGQQYGKNRYGNNAGGYNRYGNKSNDSVGQYGHHRSGDYRSGNGYGRRDDHHRGGGGNYGSGGNRYDSWNRNSGGGGGGGYYNERGYSNRGYNQQQDHSNNRYDARRRDRRGYNNNSGWNAQGGQQQWNNSYQKSGGSSESWYLWWQSNLNNLLAPSADGSAAASSSSSSSSQWNQHGNSGAHQSYGGGHYHSKGSGHGSSSMG